MTLTFYLFDNNTFLSGEGMMIENVENGYKLASAKVTGNISHKFSK